MSEIKSGAQRLINRLFPRKGSFKLFLLIQGVILTIYFIRFYNQEEYVPTMGFTNPLELELKQLDGKQDFNNLEINPVEKENVKNPVKVKFSLYGENGIVTELNTAIPGKDAVILEGQRFGEGFLRLECDSSFPVTWTYDGYGGPTFDSLQNSRKISDFKNLSTYRFQSILNFGKPSLEEYDTGKYTCCGLLKENPNDCNHFFFFVPGQKKMLQSDSFQVIVHDIFNDGPKVIIPCTASHPKAKIKLRHGSNKTIMKMGKSVDFDPKKGFRLTLSDFLNPWGNYTCELENQSVSFSLVQPPNAKSWFVQAGEVKIQPDQHSVQAVGSIPTLFECEANEEIKIFFSDKNDSEPIVVAYNTLAEEGEPGFKYKATFIAAPWQPPRRFGEQTVAFQCQKRKDGTTLHTWEYSVGTTPNKNEPPTKMELTFNYETVEFICCQHHVNDLVNRTSLNLRMKFCSSSTECDLKMKSIKFDSNLVDDNNQQNNRLSTDHECVKWKPNMNFYSGIISCQSSNGNSTQLYVYLEKNDNNSTTFEKVDPNGISNDKDLDKSLSIQVLDDDISIKPTKTLTLKCLANSFYFVKGLVWTLQKNITISSQVQGITTSSNSEVSILTSNSEELVPPFYVSSVTITGEQLIQLKHFPNFILSCSAPIWNSMEWKTVTLIDKNKNIS